MKTVADIKKESAIRKDKELEVMIRVAGQARRERAVREAKAAEERKKAQEARARKARKNQWSNVFPIWGPRPVTASR